MTVMSKIKDIIVIRLSKSFTDICPEEREGINDAYNKKLSKVYNIIIISGENDTNKTTHEIIKY